MQVLGFMTGTSLDGIDVALLETDGEAIFGFGPHAEYPMPKAVRTQIEASIADALGWDGLGNEPQSFEAARLAITELHVDALNRFIAETGIGGETLDAMGIHGQTIYHQRPKQGEPGRTIQLFEPKSFVKASGATVVSDFRSADVAAGGEGAPLSPIYHRALVRHADISQDVVVVNLGGVANITLIGADDTLLAFDTGPANGLMDQLMRHHRAGDYDQDGALAAVGEINREIVQALMQHDYFKAPAPKSLDRYDFSIESVTTLPLKDGLATLSAFTVESLMTGIDLTGKKPATIILAGGGRLNGNLCQAIAKRLSGSRVLMAEDLGWRGGALEAEAFAFMAARRLKGLPISYPSTTGVPQPMTGGVITKS